MKKLDHKKITVEQFIKWAQISNQKAGLSEEKLQKFISHWTDLVPPNFIPLFQTEEKFRMPSRLSTWKRLNYGNPKNKQPAINGLEVLRKLDF